MPDCIHDKDHLLCFPTAFFLLLIHHRKNTYSVMSPYQYETVKVEVSAEGVAHVQLHRPKKLNAFNDQSVQMHPFRGNMSLFIHTIHSIDSFPMSERHFKTFL